MKFFIKCKKAYIFFTISSRVCYNNLVDFINFTAASVFGFLIEVRKISRQFYLL